MDTTWHQVYCTLLDFISGARTLRKEKGWSCFQIIIKADNPTFKDAVRAKTSSANRSWLVFTSLKLQIQTHLRYQTQQRKKTTADLISSCRHWCTSQNEQLVQHLSQINITEHPHEELTCACWPGSAQTLGFLRIIWKVRAKKMSDARVCPPQKRFDGIYLVLTLQECEWLLKPWLATTVNSNGSANQPIRRNQMPWFFKGFPRKVVQLLCTEFIMEIIVHCNHFEPSVCYENNARSILWLERSWKTRGPVVWRRVWISKANVRFHVITVSFFVGS